MRSVRQRYRKDTLILETEITCRVDNYSMAGRLDEAARLLDRLVSLRNDVGLLAEEYHPALHRQLGNFPQAFSHVGLVNSAFLLEAMRAGRQPYPAAAMAA